MGITTAIHCFMMQFGNMPQVIDIRNLIKTEVADQIINDLMERFYYAQDEPANRLARYSGQIGAPVMASVSDSRPNTAADAFVRGLATII